MTDNLNEFLNLLEKLIEEVMKTGQPSLVILVNVLILGLAVMYVVWRIKSEMRGIKWNSLPFAQRRQMIEMILAEAIELAEWLHSNLPVTPETKQKIANQKRKMALQYAEAELRAMGAAMQDRDTLKLRLEHVFTKNHPQKIRFGPAQS